MATSEPYTPPGPALTPCAGCGVVIIARTWVHGTKAVPAHWRPLGKRVTACLGTDHTCKKGGTTS
jgi:hypothetical protein